MRLRTSGNHQEIRQQYLPLLWTKLIKRLEVAGKDSVPDVIQLMDDYVLTKDDWDALSQLGVDYMAADKLKIESQSKSTFTRLYNAASHPLPFIKACVTPDASCLIVFSNPGGSQAGNTDDIDRPDAVDKEDSNYYPSKPLEFQRYRVLFAHLPYRKVHLTSCESPTTV